MTKTNKKMSEGVGVFRLFIRARRHAIIAMLFLGFMSNAFAQSHEHEDDTLIALGKNDFTISIIQNQASQFELQIKSNRLDSLEPFFVEMHAIGFSFNDDCILQQSVNSLNLETNIEKLWGPQFISLGIGLIPPNGVYQSTFATLPAAQSKPMIKVRLFGTMHGQNFIWVGFINK